ncbi:pyruvate, water dikinase regulatory protein [Staphylococcus felis]|uniref:pyruvate, water dikinase regulatory protein n=1 Tax=Staphylococcus felis TaxID=46127 RepID=UPI002480E165|nr:pyruvate, water dikinase regulatory protein [Staphylococcus felis]MDM8328232.1 pyruvate, water dikinase regulatory protein [Staphylococcus felis]MDQ7192988.1 pyruvate, water dikinase regulatory protein [Staphylococcus felis]
MTERHLSIFIVSDSLGETAQRMVHAVMSQFPTLEQVEVKKFSFIKDKAELINILDLAKDRSAVVVTTLALKEYQSAGKAYAMEKGIQYVDYMSPLMKIVEDKSGIIPTEETGMIRKLDEEYFKRIEAIEYSVKYDDGKHFTDIGEADALILGVSRTSKTPLSMYLANKGYKIANIPLVPEVAIPETVYQHPDLKVFGLTASPKYIMNIRTERVKTLGITGRATYNNLDRIKEELAYAEEIFKKLGATVINTEYRSIEESAFYIEKFL